MTASQSAPSLLRVLLCRKDRGPMGISCVGGGAERLLPALRMGLADRGLTEQVRLEWATCFGHCHRGPNLRIVGGDFLHWVTLDTLSETLDRIEQVCQQVREADHVSVGTGVED